MTTRITEFEQHVVFDNSDFQLSNILVEQNETNLAEKEIFSQVVSFVSKAKEVIIIYSDQLISADLENTLHKQLTKGVRCYFLTSKRNFEIISKNPFKDLIIRQIDDPISSSFVVIDPKNNPDGIWSPQPLKKKNMTKLIYLNKGQIKDLYYYFVAQFWKSKNEIFHGTKSNIKEIFVSSGETIEPTINLENFMKTNLSQIDDKFNDQIILLTLPRDLQVNIEETLLLENSKTVIFEAGKFTKQLILDLNNSNELLIGPVSEMIIEIADSSWIFKEDFGLKLDDDQLQIVRSWIQIDWKYVLNMNLSELEGNFIPEVSSWENPTDDQQRVKNIEDTRIESLIFESLDDWLVEYTDYQKNEIRTKLNLPYGEKFALSIRVYRSVVPPFIERDTSKKHRIYDLWPEFLNKIVSSIDKTLKIVQTVKSFENSFDDKDSKKYIKNFIKLSSKKAQELESTKEKIYDLLQNTETMSKWNLTEFEENIFHLNLNFEKIIKETRELSKVIENQKMADLNELEALDKSKVKPKGDRKLLITDLSKYNKINLRELQIDLNKKPPYLPPKIGELWEYKNLNYIIISTIEEIGPGNEIASRYENAKLAILR